MTAGDISFDVARYGGLCLLLGALSWGQATSSKARPANPKPTPVPIAPKTPAPDQSQQADAEEVGPDAPVITINGLCNSRPADRGAASNCKTVITRAQFERLIDAGQPNLPMRARREFANRYSNALVMADKAAQMGLDQGESFEQQMKLARIQVLSQELKKAVQRQASQISDRDVEDYYQKNKASFEQVEMDRVYVPKTPERPTSGDEKSDSDAQQRLQRATQLMKDLVEKLHVRAMAGEDFKQLQADAYQAAGIKSAANSSMGKIRRVSLPPSQVSVMDLNPGEVSSVIAEPNGYFIYRVKTKETLPLAQAREEIIGILRLRRIQDEMRVIEESATPTFNEIYFRPRPNPQGAAGPASGPAQPASKSR